MIRNMKTSILSRRSPLSAVPAPVLAAICGAAAVLAGCVYRLPIQQGNHLDAEKVGLVKAGMTRTQVKYLLGTPIVPGAFDNERWDYEYYLKLRRLQTPKQLHATVYFKGDLVDHVVSDIKEEEVIEPVSKRPVSAPGA
jgi:outer membrane protein assembly factor BamE